MKHLLLVPWMMALCMGITQLSAQSMTHAQLHYQCLGNQRYQVNLILHRDCRDTTPIPSKVAISVTGLDTCQATTFLDSLSLISPFSTPVGGLYQTICPRQAGYGCMPNDSLYHFERAVYRDTLDLSVVGPACGWQLSFQSCCRTLGNSQLNNSSSSAFYTEVQRFRPQVLACNNSPTSPWNMVWTICDQAPQSIDLRIHDPDADDLTYTLVPPLSAAGQPMTYAASLSAQDPLTTLNGFQLTSDGILNFTPNGVQESAVDVLVSEHRGGQVIGQTRHTLHFVVMPCTATNQPPVVTNVSYYDSVNAPMFNNGTSTVLQQPLSNTVSSLILAVTVYDPDGDPLRIAPGLTNLDQTYGPGNWNNFFNTAPPFRPDSVQLFLSVNVFVNLPPLPWLAPPSVDCYLFSVGVDDAGCPNSNMVSLDFSYASSACTQVKGRVLLDDNYNCQWDPNEQQRCYQGRVRFEDTTTRRVFEVPVNAAGEYAIHLQDTGVYQVIFLPRSRSYQACTSFFWHHRTPWESDTLNLPVQLVDSCISLRVDIGAPLLRQCFQNYYQVNYCNDGPVTVNDAYVEVWLDSFFVVDSTTHPIDSQSGNFYRFLLDTLVGGQGFCDGFRIYGRADTSCNPNLLGTILCAAAHIYPDTACGASWQGAILDVEGECLNGVPRFRIHNIGNAAMRHPTTYRIYQDNFVYGTSAPIQLAAGASTPWVTYSNGSMSTYRVEIPQDSLYPVSAYASATLTNCSGALFYCGGWVNQFPLGDQAPNYSISCQPMVGAYDPNDKQGFPNGYGPDHAIERSTDLEYRIRFQNTGTFFAQDVVILDTLSPHLDPFSIQPQASSHSYTWRLIDNHILEFTFNNIMLPDSGRDYLGSIGFVDYRIDQRPNLPLGTRIENTAAIYFDRNPPIFTNTTWHTIDEDFVRVISVPVLAGAKETIQVRTIPNPFQETVLFRVEQEQPYPSLEVELYNALGQRVQRATAQGATEIRLRRNGLPSGVYFYRLTANDKWLHSGQLIAN